MVLLGVFDHSAYASALTGFAAASASARCTSSALEIHGDF